MEISIVGKKIELQEIHEGTSRFHYEVGEYCDFTLFLLALGKNKATVEATVRLAGKGAKATIIGIIIAKDTSTVELHTLQHHLAPETTSNLLVKTVLTDHATSVYDGGIVVAKNAQKTDAYQRNENLLLSAHAHTKSKPSLEILANDVRCTHGATVGQIPKDQLWYLATRGIGKQKGQQLIVLGFLESAFDAAGDSTIKQTLKTRIASWLA